MKPYIYGVDIGGTTIKVGLFSSCGRLMDRWELTTRTAEHGGAILPDLARWIRNGPVPTGQLEGVGVGVPGPVLADGTVNGCVNLGWGVVPVAEHLSRLLEGVPVRVVNDANAAALGEVWQGAGQGRKTLILATLGTGVGGGIVVNGTVLTGAHGSAGEIGHMQVNPAESEPCRCGKRGCLEQYASATGIVRLARQRGWAGEPTAKAVLDAARAGDATALDVAREAGSWLGLALSHVAAVVDPELILLGGGVARAGEVLLQPVRDQYRKSAFHGAAETPFALAALGNDAGMYGAARLILRPW